jgi:hypothetical protein
MSYPSLKMINPWLDKGVTVPHTEGKKAKHKSQSRLIFHRKVRNLSGWKPASIYSVLREIILFLIEIPVIYAPLSIKQRSGAAILRLRFFVIYVLLFVFLRLRTCHPPSTPCEMRDGPSCSGVFNGPIKITALFRV